MKKLHLFIFSCFLLFVADAQSCIKPACTIAGDSLIQGGCTINGDLTILNNGILNVDLTGSTADTFVVRGNILLQGNAVLHIHADSGATNKQFIVSNTESNRKTITTNDSSSVVLENIEFRTQEGDLTNAASVFMTFNANNHSSVTVVRCWLDPQKAWLLGNFSNHSSFTGYSQHGVPTEIYLLDTAQVMQHGAGTSGGIWLNFESITDTLNLPLNQTQPYNWKIGRGYGGLNTPWYFELDTAMLGLGVQIKPTAHITINGTGLPANKELTVSLLFANGTDTLDNLSVGLQNRTVANGRLTLNNVNLGPIAWQIYALMFENLEIKNSVINEIGIAGPSHVTVDSCLLQLAVLAAIGVNGSTLTVNNSEIWNQLIVAANNSDIILNNCDVIGSSLITIDALSSITVNGGCFHQNPSGCTENTMVNMITGQPQCNPMATPGYPKVLSPNATTLNGVNYNCVTGITDLQLTTNNFSLSPNPATNSVIITVDESMLSSTATITDVTGRKVAAVQLSSQHSALSTSNFANGIYLVNITGTGGSNETKKLVINK